MKSRHVFTCWHGHAVLVFMLSSFLFGGVAAAATTVTKVNPNRISLEPGRSVTVAIEGTELDRVGRILVYENRRPSRSVNARWLGRPGPHLARLTISARPNARPGATYDIVLLGNGNRPVRIDQRQLALAITQDRGQMQAARNYGATEATGPSVPTLSRPEARASSVPTSPGALQAARQSSRPVAVSVAGNRADKVHPGQDAINRGPGQGVGDSNTSVVQDLADTSIETVLKRPAQVNTSPGTQSVRDRLSGNRGTSITGIAGGTDNSSFDPSLNTGVSTNPSELLPDVGRRKTTEDLLSGTRDAQNSMLTSGAEDPVNSQGGYGATDPGVIAGDGGDRSFWDNLFSPRPKLYTEGERVTAFDARIKAAVPGTYAEEYSEEPVFETGTYRGAPGGGDAELDDHYENLEGFEGDGDASIDEGNKQYAEGYIPPEERERMFSPWTAAKLKEKGEKEGRGSLTNKFGNVTPNPMQENANSSNSAASLRTSVACAPEGDPRPHCQEPQGMAVDPGRLQNIDPGNIDPARD